MANQLVDAGLTGAEQGAASGGIFGAVVGGLGGYLNAKNQRNVTYWYQNPAYIALIVMGIGIIGLVILIEKYE